MFRRLMILAFALTLASSIGLVIGTVPNAISGPGQAFAAGAGPQFASGSGVGPSTTGATGQARACETHATNSGNSYGYGLQCATLSATITGPNSQYPGACSLYVQGSGLLPGSTLTYTSPGGQTYPLYNPDATTLVTVAPNGTVDETTFFGISPGTFTLTATTASGGSITTTFSPTC